MLGFGNLLKYEMKAVGRIMIPSYGAFLIVSAIFGFTVANPNFTGGFAGIISALIGFLYFAMSVAVLAFTIIILIQRFYRNLLGNEGYLYFTLPAGINAHIANKTLSAGIWLSLTVIAGVLSAFIIGLFSGAGSNILEAFRSLLSEINSFDGGIKVLLIILEVIVFAFVAFAEKALKIYAAVSVGQLWTKHRALGAVAAWIGFTFVESAVAGVLNMIPGGDSLYENLSSEFASMQLGLLMVFVVVLITMAIYWLVNYRMMDRHLNLQ